MAQSGPNFIELALLGVAGWLAWNWFTQPAAASTATPAVPVVPPATPATPATPPVAYTPPTLTQQLQTLAGPGVSSLNADQWNYYYTTAAPQGLGQPAVANFNTIFFPSGRPSDPTQNPQMTAAQFVAAIGNPGLSGVVVPVPPTFIRGIGYFTLGDLRNAGRR